MKSDGNPLRGPFAAQNTAGSLGPHVKTDSEDSDTITEDADEEHSSLPTESKIRAKRLTIDQVQSDVLDFVCGYCG